jgi:hypothetical protein
MSWPISLGCIGLILGSSQMAPSVNIFAKLSSSWQFHLKLSWVTSIITVPVQSSDPTRPTQKSIITATSTFLENGKRPQFFGKWRTPSKKGNSCEFEYHFKILECGRQLELYRNGRRPQLARKWKPPKFYH